MPLKVDSIIGIKGLSVCRIEYGKGSLWIDAKLSGKPRCPYCAVTGRKSLRVKDKFDRVIQHDSIGSKRVYIKLSVPKYYCRRCGKYFRRPIPGVLAYQRGTESLRADIATKHELGISKSSCSELFKVSHSKVERCYKHVHKRAVLERSSNVCPRVMGIDEHFLNKRTGYVTTLVNLKSRRVFDLLPGRSEKSLESYLKRLKGRHRVRVIVMDLSSTYRSIVEKYFPNAMIVADRFHVVRLINQKLMELWKGFDETGRKNRGLISLMRRHRYKLSDKQKLNLERYFKEYPMLGACYHALKELKELMCEKGLNRRGVKKRQLPKKLLKLMSDFEMVDNPILASLVKTLRRWLDPIGRMWRFRLTNSITEGLHNKMELIQRRAYGFHSFENYKIRVIALCG